MIQVLYADKNYFGYPAPGNDGGKFRRMPASVPIQDGARQPWKPWWPGGGPLAAGRTGPGAHFAHSI